MVKALLIHCIFFIPLFSASQQLIEPLLGQAERESDSFDILARADDAIVQAHFTNKFVPVSSDKEIRENKLEAIENKCWACCGKGLGAFNNAVTKPFLRNAAKVLGYVNTHWVKPRWTRAFRKHPVAEKFTITLGTVTAASASANLIAGTFDTVPFLLTGAKLIAFQGNSANTILFGGITMGLGLWPFYYLDWYLRIKYGWPVATGFSTMLPLASLEHLVDKAIKACGDKSLMQEFKAWYKETNPEKMDLDQIEREIGLLNKNQDQLKFGLLETQERLAKLRHVRAIKIESTNELEIQRLQQEAQDAERKKELGNLSDDPTVLEQQKFNIALNYLACLEDNNARFAFMKEAIARREELQRDSQSATTQESVRHRTGRVTEVD